MRDAGGSFDPEVLVVDDDDAMRMSLLGILRSVGFEVEGATSAQAALAVLSSRRVGVLLLDVRMPGLSGPDLLDLVPSPPPVILTSGFEQTISIDGWPTVVAYLPKPVQPSELVDTVRSALQL